MKSRLLLVAIATLISGQTFAKYYQVESKSCDGQTLPTQDERIYMDARNNFFGWAKVEDGCSVVDFYSVLTLSNATITNELAEWSFQVVNGVGRKSSCAGEKEVLPFAGEKFESAQYLKSSGAITLNDTANCKKLTLKISK